MEQPITREEQFLAAAAGEDVQTPEPITRTEQYLAKIAEGIQVDPEEIKQDVEDWLEDNIDPETGYVIDNTLSIANAAADAKKVGDELADVKSAINPAYENIAVVTGEEQNINSLFEMGTITIGTGGWTYSDSTKRIRSKNGITIMVRPGDTFGLKSYTGIRYYIGWQRATGTYGTAGQWLQQDFTFEEYGQMVVTIGYTPEVVISDYNVLADLVFIKRVSSINSGLKTIECNVKGVAHRGFSFYAPENTIPAYVAAKQYGYKYVECDVGLTADNIPVLLHDSTINRTARNADGTSLASTVTLSETNYEDLLDYDFGIWKGSQYAGTKIPTFEEFIKYCKYANLHPYCDLKQGFTSEIIASLIGIVKALGMLRNITWVSFSATVLGYVKEIDPKARLGFLSSSYSEAVDAVIADLKNGTNEVFLDLERTAATASNVESIVSTDTPLEVYTVDTTDHLYGLNPYITGATTDVIDVSGLLLKQAETLLT